MPAEKTNKKQNTKQFIMNVPQDLLYTADHEWVKIEGNIATIGITDYAQNQLGDIVFVEIETLDETLKKGEVLGTIEAVKTVSDMFSPISGVVTEVNESIEDAPDVINNDPYGNGWLAKVEMTNKTVDTDALLGYDAYTKLID